MIPDKWREIASKNTALEIMAFSITLITMAGNGKPPADTDDIWNLQESLRGDQLFLLALPPSYGAADICSFVGPYLRVIRELRLVRRDDRRVTTYSVLLRFDTSKSAEQFCVEFDGKPVTIPTCLPWSTGLPGG